MIRLENIAYRFAGWLRERIQKRRDRREIAAAFPPGTRIVTTGKCCAGIRGRIVQGTIVDYILEVGDYHVILDGAPKPQNPPGLLHRPRDFKRALYLCRKGFEPTGGQQNPPPTIADWRAA